MRREESLTRGFSRGGLSRLVCRSRASLLTVSNRTSRDRSSGNPTAAATLVRGAVVGVWGGGAVSAGEDRSPGSLVAPGATGIGRRLCGGKQSTESARSQY